MDENGEVGKRRMPEKLQKYLLRVQGGKMYLPAAYRLVWFRDECPDWGVETVLVEGGQEAGFATVRASIHNDGGRTIACAHKTETKIDFPAGWVEKAETGAIARALAIAGFGTQFSQELEDDGSRPADSPQRSERAKQEGEVWAGTGKDDPTKDLCPGCNAPVGKPHGKKCEKVV